MNCNKNPVPPIWDGAGVSDAKKFDGQRRSAAMFRWWIPAGFVTREELEREIKTTAEHGFRGLEICVNMADTGYKKAQRAEFGWGTPHWKETYRFILKTALRYGVQIDMTISPGWPAGIPGIQPEDVCAAKELNTCSTAPFTGRYQGPVPTEIDMGLVNPDPSGMPPPPSDGAMREEEPEPENRPELQTVTAARVVGVNQVPMTGGRFGPPSANPDAPKTNQYLLDPDSLQTVPYVRQADGSYAVDFDGGEGRWILFAFWMQGSCQTNRQGSATELPCYAVNHFSRVGAKAVTDFWETHILDDEMRALLRENGGVIFEDSIELDISDYATHWSPGHLEHFQAHRGYDMRPFLPLLTGLTYMDPKNYKYELADEAGEVSALGTRFRNDYCQFLTEVYQEEHIGPIQDWAAALGMGYRSQGYGLPFDLTAIAAYSHGPEGESLGFGEGVRRDDRFRTVAGGAYMARRPIISDEMGAVAGEGYRWTWESMLRIIDGNFSGGANLIIFHGMPYSVSDVSRWPGYSPFGFGLAGQWGPRQPEWEYIDGLSDYLRRTQAILQQGKPRVDVGILKVYYEGFNFAGLLPDQTLARQGYTYGFLTPNTLELDPTVKDGVLAPEGPGYRALVLDGEAAMPPETVERLMAFAEAGLKIVLAGRMPDHTPFVETDMERRDRQVRDGVARLLQHENVRAVASETEIAGALAELGVYPALKPEMPTELLSIRRQTNQGDFYFIHHRGEEATVRLGLMGRGRVYALDPWNGDVRQIPASFRDGYMEISRDFVRDETGLFVLCPGETGAASALVPAECRVIGGPWELTVERWQQDETGPDTTSTRRTVIDVGQTELLPWSHIPALGWAVSGIGTYQTALELPEEWPLAELRFPQVLCQSLHLEVNGARVPVNHHTFTAQLRGLLHRGKNTLTVRLVTTLGNQLMEDGAFPPTPWMPEEEKPAEFGLLAPPVLQRYKEIKE